MGRPIKLKQGTVVCPLLLSVVVAAGSNGQRLFDYWFGYGAGARGDSGWCKWLTGGFFDSGKIAETVLAALDSSEQCRGIRMRAQSSAGVYGLAIGVSRYLDVLDGQLSCWATATGQSNEHKFNITKSTPEAGAKITKSKGEMA